MLVYEQESVCQTYTDSVPIRYCIGRTDPTAPPSLTLAEEGSGVKF